MCSCIRSNFWTARTNSSLSSVDIGEVPGRPDPPVLGKATHHSVELSWHPPHHLPGHGRMRYCIQEEDAAKKDGFGTVYKYILC